MQYQYPAYSGFRCVACNIAFNSFDDQKQHYFIYHSRPINVAHDKIKEGPILGRNVAKKIKVAPKDIRCGFCDVSCSSEAIFDFHMKGKKHAKAISKLSMINKGNTASNNTKITKKVVSASVEQPPQVIYSADFACEDCDIKCGTMDILQKHLQGGKHARTVRNKEHLRMIEMKDPSVYCDKCDVSLLPDLMILHRNGGKHKRKCNDKAPTEPAGKKRKVSDGIITTVEHCGYCLLDLKNTPEAIEHYQSKEHAVNCCKAGSNFICEVCLKSFNKQDMLELHFKGFKHYAKVNRGNPIPEGEMAEKLLKLREKVKSLSKRQKPKGEHENFVADVNVDIVDKSNEQSTDLDTDIDTDIPNVVIEVESFDI